MISDPIGDMLIRIKNAYLVKKQTVEIPFSKMKEKIGILFVENGYAKKCEVEKDKTISKLIKMTLEYEDKIPSLTDLKRISKPGLRVYKGKHELPRVLGGIGMAIISTSKGLMTEKEANRKGLGGEVICKVW